MDFEKLYLTKHEINILISTRTGEIITLHQSSAEHLLKLGFLEIYAFSDTPNSYTITSLGLRYISHLDTLTAENNDRKKHEWINTAIAIGALVVAIIALFK